MDTTRQGHGIDRTGTLRIATALLVALVAALACAHAPAAHAAIYWGDDHAEPDTGADGGQPGWGDVGRVGLDGKHALSGFVGDPEQTGGVAVDAKYLYTSDSQGGGREFPEAPGAIARVRLDGTGRPKLLAAGAYAPVAVAVDGAHLYWADRDAGKIGRANLDGSNVQTDFVTGAQGPQAVVVDAAHVYWTNGKTGTVGRANLDGSGVVPAFVPAAPGVVGLAVDATHLYWANPTAGTIGQANLDGTGDTQSLVTGIVDVQGVAVDAGHLYWSLAHRDKTRDGVLGRANLDGSAPTPRFVAGLDTPSLLAVDTAAVPAPPKHLKVAITAKPQTRSRIRHYGLRARVAFNQPGQVLLTATVTARTARSLHLHVRRGAKSVVVFVPGEAYDDPDYQVTAYLANLQPTNILVEASTKIAKALRHAHHVTVTLHAKASTESGLRATATRTLTLP